MDRIPFSKKQFLKLGLPLVAAIAVAGCGGSSSSGGGGGDNTPSGNGAGGSTTAAAAPKACDLLTAKLASSAIGKATVSQNVQVNPQETHCQYKSKTGFMDILVGPWSYINTPDPTAKAVSGLGDEAHASASGLAVKVGNNGFHLDVAITGTYHGKASNDIQALQTKLEEKLGAKLVSGL